MKPIYIYPKLGPRLTLRSRIVIWSVRYQAWLDWALAFVLGLALGSLLIWMCL